MTKCLLRVVDFSHNFDDVRALTQAPPEGTNLLLLREPDNPYDPNALKVYLPIGYIDRKGAEKIAPKLDANCDAFWDATITKNGGYYLEVEIVEPQDAIQDVTKPQGQ